MYTYMCVYMYTYLYRCISLYRYAHTRARVHAHTG